ncbi:facilitated trehalose transporter Tret1-2 homolog [Maniola hyperantus]|uniref:facilitated trehalose transporter Tret1-2 homolog n=1 Tax=Aphantopus hyperantus TaxID=2795564 RepID=UPI0037496E29
MDFSNEGENKKKKYVFWIYFFRQFFSCGSVILNCFIFGVYTGAPTVIIPQMRKEANSTDIATPEMVSWLSSASTYSAVPWAVLWPMIAYRYGRKIPLILVSVNVLVGNIIFYCSTSITELIISQATLGMWVGSTLPIAVMIMSEYTSPKYRGIFLTLKGATFYWGVWVSNAIGTFFHWRNIGVLVFICGIYNLISCIFCYESPYWLATKGHFDECAKIHRWLKGTDENSEDELRKLTLSQKKHLNIKAQLNKQVTYSRRIKILNIIRCTGFYKPLAYACLPICLYNLSGKVACTVYAIDIIKKITSSERIAYEGMLILDAVTVVGMYLGCALSKIVTRRKQLLGFSSAGVVFLYALSVYLYMIRYNVISEKNFVTLFLLMGYSISISCGPLIIATSCAAELSPSRYRSYFICCFGVLCNVVYATVLKISPFVFQLCGTHGAFLFYAVFSSIFICLVYKYLPETKDKTIQEIQELIIGVPQRELVSLKKQEYKSTLH